MIDNGLFRGVFDKYEKQARQVVGHNESDGRSRKTAKDGNPRHVVIRVAPTLLPSSISRNTSPESRIFRETALLKDQLEGVIPHAFNHGELTDMK